MAGRQRLAQEGPGPWRCVAVHGFECPLVSRAPKNLRLGIGGAVPTLASHGDERQRTVGPGTEAGLELGDYL